MALFFHKLIHPLHIHQEKQLKEIEFLHKYFTQDYFSQRAKGACIASVCQSEAASVLSFAAQVTHKTMDDARFLN